MWDNEISTDIAAPVDQVYRYLADFPRHKEWSRGVAELEPVTNGAIGVGTELKASETVPAKFTSYSRITDLAPDRRIAWEAWAEGMMKTQWSFELSPNGSGTHLVQCCHFQPTSLMGTVMLNLMRKRQIPKENRQSLERIKAIIEGGNGK